MLGCWILTGVYRLVSDIFIMAKEGFPFVLVPILLALFAAFLQIWIVAGLFALLAGFMAFFFRDPERKVPDDPKIVVSAADGRVTRIDKTDENTTISVFLSPLNVHINRSPIAGKISVVEYIKGKKAPATSDQASFTNERNSLTIVGNEMTVKCTQVAGILARRIVCWNRQGDELALGQRFGLIKFGSRTDVKMPSTVEVLVSIGDRVKGGETVIARIK
ncbi:MAG: phosphatidylserine decarboxylase [Acidobacteriota bacterium]